MALVYYFHAFGPACTREQQPPTLRVSASPFLYFLFSSARAYTVYAQWYVVHIIHLSATVVKKSPREVAAVSLLPCRRMRIYSRLWGNAAPDGGGKRVTDAR